MSDQALAADAGIEYPTTDGRPVAETPLHYRRLADAAHALSMRLESVRGAYVGVNMLVYDQQGNPRRHLSPDLFVAFGVADREREIYKLWEEKPPALVLEVTSKTTRREDERKMSRYAHWGVAEYFLYDPRGEYVRPPLQGFALKGRRYRAMEASVLVNGKRGFASEVLGLGLWLDGSDLRFYDAAAGRNLSTPREAERRSKAAESRAAAAERIAAAEATRRRELEAELTKLRNR